MATSDLIGGGNIEPRGLEEEMRSSYLDYAMSVIVGRALPDVRDGLKPVHRRVLFAMNEAGLQPNRPYSKCARIVGDVMGNYHPHGDSAIYDTLVRLAQDFSMRNPLVDGQGNFGSVDDDPAAAMRYTEARLAALAREMLRDLDEDTVDFEPELRRAQAGAGRPPGAVPEPARQRRLRHRRRHGDEHPAAQPARDDRRHDRLHRGPGHRHRRPDAAHQGPGLPDRRRDPRRHRHPRGLRDRPRPRPRAGPRALGGHRRRQGGDHRHRAALHGEEGRRRRPDPQDRRARPREEDHRDLRPPRRDRPQGHAGRDRAQARRDPEGRAEQALQAHRDADDVRRQRRRAGRQRAADAPAALDHPQLRPAPARGHRPPLEVRAAQARGAQAHPRGPADRARQPRRGDRADPRRARPRRRPRRPDRAVRADLHPGPGDPRAAAPAADRARERPDPHGARRHRRADQRAARAARRRGEGARR